MPFIGSQPTRGAYLKCDAITTSATASYTLQVNGGSVSPASANNMIVSLNGVIQAPQDAYTVTGSTITFDSALTSSDVIDFILILGNTDPVGTPADGTITTSKLQNNAITTAKLADDAITSAKLPSGSVLQVVTATDSTERTTASSSFVTASNTLAVTLTPASTSSKVFVTASLSYGSPSGTISFYPTIYRGSTNLAGITNGFGNLFSGSSYQYSHATLQILDSPSTTSATTYQIYFRIGSGSNVGRINNGAGGSFSTITAFEIAG